MKLLYFDCPMGISGDMFLASLIDLGVDKRLILKELRKLKVDRIEVAVGKELRHSISCTSFRVKLRESSHHRTFRDIKKIISGSALSSGVKRLSTDIFRTIAEAEGKVHGISADKVHFHEIGAMDSIIDIVGAAIALEAVGPDKVICSPLPLGSGWTNTMHGKLPIPAPATLEILTGAPVVPSPVAFELTTPTGAAIMMAAASFGPMPAMTVEKVGYGAGKKDLKERANIVRAVLGSSGASGEAEGERLHVLETNIDDMSPQLSGYLIEKLISSGALDAFHTAVQMKKSRPGVLLTVLAKEEDRTRLMEMIFRESTSIGVRAYPVERHCLERKVMKVRTPYGSVSVKASYLSGRAVNAQPEYEDCRLLAERKGVPLKRVMDSARAAALEKLD
ncbi:MAG: nickel pincer cofactor biosynthesis protein LarC [Candidatus Methylomirabilis sp.]|nr:nickel pincer cofactor biosynthesis protein LarC [Deltaproteobacteria bacterium]